MAVLVANALVVLGSLVYFYFDVTRISDYPTQPPNQGEVKVYFDEPDVPALMEVRASDDDSGRIDVTLSVEDSCQADSVGFKLVFTGLLGHPPELPVMQELDEYGCWFNIYVVPEENMTACTTNEASPDGYPGGPPVLEQLVISAQLTRNESNAMWTQVTLYPDLRYSASVAVQDHLDRVIHGGLGDRARVDIARGLVEQWDEERPVLREV